MNDDFYSLEQVDGFKFKLTRRTSFVSVIKSDENMNTDNRVTRSTFKRATRSTTKNLNVTKEDEYLRPRKTEVSIQKKNKSSTIKTRTNSAKTNQKDEQNEDDLMVELSSESNSELSSELSSSIENKSFENFKTSTARKRPGRPRFKKFNEDEQQNSSFEVSIPDENNQSSLSRQFGDQLNFGDSNISNTIQSKSAFDLQIDYEELEELPDHFDYKKIKLKEDVFIGYEDAKDSLHFLIKNSINRGESGTVLVYGGQGSGKTKFVNTCLDESEWASNCRILRLSGLIHGNDATTIHHIARFFDIQFNDLPRIMDQIKEDCKKRMANVIIVLDEFEVFCDKNQYLLYCFFDLIQYVGHILVIGITSRYDCIELLEKRVKSRMNHKTIVLKPPFTNLGEYLDFAKKLIDKEDFKFTKLFQHNLEIQYSKSHSIVQLKNCLYYNMRSKKATQKVYQGVVDRYLTGKDEKVSLICNYLTNLEICVLLLASKLVYVKELERFSVDHLLNLAKEIPSQIATSRKLILMATGTLIDYDLIVPDEKKPSQSKQLFLTEWTPLVLNVFKFQIDDSLKRLENKIPTGVYKLANI